MTARCTALLCALGAAALSGCGASSFPAPAAPLATDPCVVTDGAASRPDTVRVALLEPVDATHAPVAVNDAERLVFRQLYETLVRVDCRDSVRPALAVRWREEDGGRRWVFELATGARFWDGTPVDAAAVRASWTGTPGLPVTNVEAQGARGVVVTLSAPRSLEAFGDAAWSVVKRIPESSWPVGTTAVWVRDWDLADGARMLRALPTPVAPAGTAVLEFRAAERTDPRDLLDRGMDLVVTRDARGVGYALGRDDWRVYPLPWDLLYVLASPVRLRTGTATQLDSAARAALARDAVRDDARGATLPPWWAGDACPAEPAGFAVPPQQPLVTFPSAMAPAGDRAATDLVARLVARSDLELADLIGTRLGALRAEPVPEFDGQLATGEASVFVFPLAADPLDPCRALAHLRARAPWLHAAEAWSASLLVPLVETRAHLLVRRAPPVALDRDGGVRLLPGGLP